MGKLRRKILIGICLFSLNFSLVGAGFASFVQQETTAKIEGNVDVDFGGISEQGLKISDTSYTNMITFDFADSSKESLNFRFYGRISSYDLDWSEIRINLQIDSAHRNTYYSLIDEGLIKEPTFESLTKTSAMFSNLEGTYYRSALQSSNGIYYRDFILNYNFGYGSFFKNMHPVEFFESNEKNNYKKGNEYTLKERNELYAKIQALKGAKYTLYLETFDSNNNYTLILDAKEGVFDGSGTTKLTYSNLTYHSVVKLPNPYREKFRFGNWGTYNSVTYYANNRVYINEIAIEGSNSTTTMSASYDSLTTNLTVSILQDGLQRFDPTVEIRVYASGIDSYSSYTTSDGTPLNIDLNVGDRVRFGTLNRVESYKFINFSSPDLLGFYTVKGFNPIIQILPSEAEPSFDITGLPDSIPEQGGIGDYFYIDPPTVETFFISSYELKWVSTSNNITISTESDGRTKITTTGSGVANLTLQFISNEITDSNVKTYRFNIVNNVRIQSFTLSSYSVSVSGSAWSEKSGTVTIVPVPSNATISGFGYETVSSSSTKISISGTTITLTVTIPLFGSSNSGTYRIYTTNGPNGNTIYAPQNVTITGRR